MSRAEATLRERGPRGLPDLHLVDAGICPAAACRPGHQPPVFCDREVDPTTGRHTDGVFFHRGHDGTGDALWG